MLTGQEVKSIRAGGAKLDGAYLQILQGELWLVGCSISAYAKTGRLESYDPQRTRKVLVTKKELQHLAGKLQQKGLTIVPFSLYPSARRIKLSFALCQGKKAYDKRETLKTRDLTRRIGRFLRDAEDD